MQIGVEMSKALENKRVFIVDDDEITRAALQFMLHDEFEAHEVPDIGRAFEKAKSQPPDLILLSEGVVKADGLDLIDALRHKIQLRQNPHCRRSGKQCLRQGMRRRGGAWLSRKASQGRIRSSEGRRDAWSQRRRGDNPTDGAQYAIKQESKMQAEATQALDAEASEAAIYACVKRFYELGGADPLLGPVFAATIPEPEPHFEVVANFWSHALLGTARYQGTPFGVHVNIPGRARTFRALGRDIPGSRKRNDAGRFVVSGHRARGAYGSVLPVGTVSVQGQGRPTFPRSRLSQMKRPPVNGGLS